MVDTSYKDVKENFGELAAKLTFLIKRSNDVNEASDNQLQNEDNLASDLFHDFANEEPAFNHNGPIIVLQKINETVRYGIRYK